MTHEIEESFTLTKEVGPTHAKEFEITCTLGAAKTVGKGKTKKIAKKEAAAKMMRILAEKPDDLNPLEWVRIISKLRTFQKMHSLNLISKNRFESDGSIQVKHIQALRKTFDKDQLSFGIVIIIQFFHRSVSLTNSLPTFFRDRVNSSSLLIKK